MTHRAHELPAALRREIRGLANLVHERRLGLELAKLETEFGRWHRREVDAFELAALLHRFHEGEPRRLWLAYNTNRMAELVGLLRAALREGILRENETSVELLATLREGN